MWHYRNTKASWIRKEGPNRHEWHVGAAILVHETVQVKEIQLKTPLQAVTAEVKNGIFFTIVSLSNSRKHEINERLLSEHKNQLPPPVLITGDFKSYHPIWGSDTADSRGTQAANFIENNNLNILNNGNATRI